MRISLILYFCLVFSAVQSQVYSFTLTPGWRATRCLEINSDSILVVGLTSENLQQDYQKHRLQMDWLNDEGQILSSKTYNATDRTLTTTHSAAGLIYDDGNIFVGGSSVSNDTAYSLVSRFDKELNLTKSIEQKTEKNDFTYSLVSYRAKYYKLGLTQRLEPLSRRARVSLSSMDKNLNQIISLNEYTWDHFSDYGGCNLIARNMLQRDNHLYIAAVGRANSALYSVLEDGLILKVDTLGNEVWRLELTNDSTTYHNLLIAPLANGNYLATYQDYYHKPFNAPRGTNRWPEQNDKCTVNFIEFSSEGNIIKNWNLKSQLSNIFEKERSQEALSQHLEVTKDGSIVIIGNSHRSKLNYYEVGFALKMDKYGNYKWFRRYGPSLSNPTGFNQQELSLNGVTELSNGNLALAGEYKSDASDSFPTGTQRGIVLFVDSFGCLEPGCEANDKVGVEESRPFDSAQDDFFLYPNPSNGVLEISNSKNQIPKGINVFDMQGRKVNFSLSGHQLSIDTPAGIYYLRILRDDGVSKVHKVIVE